MKPSGIETNAARIFLCYAEEDRNSVEQLYQHLCDAGFAPWMKSLDLLPGQRREQVWQGIREAEFFMACLSNWSVKQRGFVQTELRNALDVWQEKLPADIYLIPVRLEECDIPDSLADFVAADLFAEGGFERIVRAIQFGMQQREAEQSASFGQQKPDRAQPAPLGRKDALPRYELGLPWKFDLTALIKRCISELVKRKSGLIGFVVPSDVAPRDYLRDRLINEWKGSQFSYTCHALKLHPLTFPIDMAVTHIVNCTAKSIKHGDVLFVGSASSKDAPQFWQHLCAKIERETYKHRLVIILATDSACHLPENIILLPSPQCEEYDIHQWVTQLIESTEGLSEEIISPLIDKIIGNCRYGDQLNMQLVYMHIPQVIKDPAGYCL
ncbi:TIR protein [Candidatus Vecturithrix granuli]|uniref:TIR protein n=1 Tax=Vecturithrix granuli TaxID=1499967 RepID=A0A081C828_VECG1|nr:TIR protein [Candidatus Vecturithrix granuli]